MELQGRVAELMRQGLSLAAVSYDPVAVLADFSKRRGITFAMLSDPGSATIKRYGIFNTTAPEANQQSYGIPFPGTFMLNAQGVVTSRFFEQAYQERSTVGSIMARLGNKVDVQAITLSSPQLQLTSFATDSIVDTVRRRKPAPEAYRSVATFWPGPSPSPVPGSLGRRGRVARIEARMVQISTLP